MQSTNSPSTSVQPRIVFSLELLEIASQFMQPDIVAEVLATVFWELLPELYMYFSVERGV